MKPILPLLTIAVITLAGCATQDEARQEPRPGDGIKEYRQIVQESLKAIGEAASALDRVSAHTNSCPPRLITAFSREVLDLQAESIRVRSRSQAIQARGQAYFDNWQETLDRVKDPRVRALAQEHRPQLQECFARIKGRAGQAGDAFKPFLSGLRKLQNSLESDPASISTDSTRQLIRVTQQSGQLLAAALEGIRQELDTMKALLTPSKSPTPH
jgi:hypothetical protein